MVRLHRMTSVPQTYFLLLYTSEPLFRQSLSFKWPPVFIFYGCITNYHKVSSLTKRGWFCFSQFSSIAQWCPTLCDPVDCSTLGFPVRHQLLEMAQTHVHWVSDAIQPSHPLLSPSPLAFNLSQHQGLFQWVGSSPQVAKVLEFQLQHQSFQWIFRTDSL